MDVPSIAPATVPIESARSACFALGSFPSFIKPAWEPTPISVPTVSKKSRRNRTTMGVMYFHLRTPRTSIFMNVGAMDGGTLTKPLNFTTPRGIPARAPPMMPRSKAPFTFLMYKTTVMRKPMRNVST